MPHASPSILALAVLAAVLLPAAPAGAITNGTPDGTGHPSTGGLVSPTQYSDGTWLYCSGTLISPTVFLTAAHCAEDGERVGVTFDPATRTATRSTTARSRPTRSTRAAPATATTSPSSCSTGDQGHHAGAAARGRSRCPASPRHAEFTSVGYGAYEVTNEPGGHRYLYDDVRMVATGTLNAVNKTWLRISMNASTGNGGTCYGDSGGPNFLGTSNVIAAITITGDAVCRSTNVDYRLDTESARAFLGQYVTLP